MNQINTIIDLSFITDFNKVSDKVVCKLISKDKNKELIENIPHVSFLDLAIVCYFPIDTVNGEATIQIQRNLMESWQISEKKLFEIAKANTFRIMSFKFETIGQALYPLGEIKEEEMSFPPYNILSNEDRFLGAVGIINNDILDKIGDQLKDDFFILPSSIHDVIIVPRCFQITTDFPVPDQLSTEQFKKNFLLMMVRDVNTIAVIPEDFLSDNIYFYKREEHKVSIVEI